MNLFNNINSDAYTYLLKALKLVSVQIEKVKY